VTYVEMLVRRRSSLSVADAMTAQSTRKASLLHYFLFFCNNVQLHLMDCIH